MGRLLFAGKAENKYDYSSEQNCSEQEPLCERHACEEQPKEASRDKNSGKA
jgi:hypothetical protein